MPHTRSKKKKALAQAAAEKKILHTKRTQIEDEDGWTHVIETGKSRTVLNAKEKEIFSVGDFEKNGVFYVDRTVGELETDLRFYTRLWEESGAEALLRGKLVEGNEGRRSVEGVVCLGLGSLQSARREGRRASFTQLAALRTLIEILGGEQKLPCVLQDPQFTDIDKEFLTSLGYMVVEDPEAFGKITDSSLVYAIHCYADVYKSVSDGARPAIMVGTDVENFGKFNISEKADTIAESLKGIVKDCEEIDFPQVRHDFSDTKIYWRKVSITATD